MGQEVSSLGSYSLSAAGAAEAACQAPVLLQSCFFNGPGFSIPRGHQSQRHNALKGCCSLGLCGVGWRAGKCLLYQLPKLVLVLRRRSRGRAVPRRSLGCSHAGLLNFAFSKVSVLRNGFGSPQFCVQFRNRPKIGSFFGMVGN